MALDTAEGERAPRARSSVSAHNVRVMLVVALAATQFVAVSWLFDFADAVPRWSNPVFLLRLAILTGIIGLAGFVLLAWPNRHDILDRWSQADHPHRFASTLAVNLAMFAMLVPATLLLTSIGRSAPPLAPPWSWFWAYSVLLLSTGVSLALVYAPLQFWLSVLRRHWHALAAAMAVAILTQLAGLEAQQGWESLSAATLAISFTLLAGADRTAFVDYATQRLGAQEFWVIIDKSCSGYEGVALVIMFVGLYLFAFRKTLRFPAAFLLLPFGVATVWLLNSVRVTLLVLVGAYVSPDVALKGFHSQAGWLSFLAVTIAIMVAAHRLQFFNSRAASILPTDPADRLALALIAPFMGLMAGHIIMAAAAPRGEGLILIKLVLVAVPIWLFRDIYRGIASSVSPVAVIIGAVVGLAWIATDQGNDRAANLTAFLAAQGPAMAAAWLLVRALIGILLVPVAEELAFRGFLHQFIAQRGPVTISPVRFSVLAILVTSLTFGILHERWLAGALAGAAFSLIMLRRGRLSDAVVAHIAANAVVIGWAIAAQRWSLL